MPKRHSARFPTATLAFLCLLSHLATVGQLCSDWTSIPAIPPKGAPKIFTRSIDMHFGMEGTRVYSSFDSTSNGTYRTIPASVGFWINLNGDDGPVNRCGGWAPVTKDMESQGFSVCIDVPEDKTYHVGYSSDNYAMIILDNDTIIRERHTDSRENLQLWKIIPVQLRKGKHYLQAIGTNVNGPATIGMEVYDNTAEEILASTSYAGLKLVFSSKDRFGLPVMVGDEEATYTCPTGYIIDYCSQSLPVCTRSADGSPVLTINAPPPVCAPASIDLTLPALTAGSTPGLAFSYWKDTLATIPLANPAAVTAAGTSFVKGTNAKGCSAVKPVRTEVRPQPALTVAVSPSPSVCAGVAVTMTASGAATLAWDKGVANGAAFTPTASDTYRLRGVSAEGCAKDTAVSVQVNPLPQIRISKSNDLSCTVGSAILTATGARSYRWSPGALTDDSTKAAAVVRPATGTTFSVTGTSDSGCTSTQQVQVNVDRSAGTESIRLPNAFTPNGDALNDCFGTSFLGSLQKAELTVFDRFGNRVFAGRSSADCWDGSYRSRPAPAGMYAYRLNAETLCGTLERKGLVSLIR